MANDTEYLSQRQGNPGCLANRDFFDRAPPQMIRKHPNRKEKRKQPRASGCPACCSASPHLPETEHFHPDVTGMGRGMKHIDT